MNNHARSKQKRRKLRHKMLMLFNFLRRTVEKRQKKIKEAHQQKKVPFIRNEVFKSAKMVAVHVNSAWPTNHGFGYFADGPRRDRNQRQKRRDGRRAQYNSKRWKAVR